MPLISPVTNPKAGDRVYAAGNVVVSCSLGQSIAVRWGAPGVVQSIPEGKENFAIVLFDVREDVAADGSHGINNPLQLPLSKLSTAPLQPLQGTWVQLAVDAQFLSSKIVQRGTPALVLDIRDRGAAAAPTLLVRTAPVNIQSPMEFSVDMDEVEPFTQLPEGLPPCVGDLPGGWQFGDLIYAAKDVHISMGEPPRPTCVVGKGDTGVIFAQARTEEARKRGEVQVRFEVRRDQGRSLWLSIGQDYLLKEPPLVPGRRVRLEEAVCTSGGTMIEAGQTGSLMEIPVNGNNERKLIVRLDGAGGLTFVAPQKGLKVITVGEPFTDNEKQARIAELEFIAKNNSEAGDHLRNVSLLEQNFWSLTNFGSGIGVSFTAQSMWERTTLVANTMRCLLLREKAAEGMDGTLGGEMKSKFNHKALVGDASRVGPYRGAIQAAARGKHALDIGTGPMAFLSRLCLVAGASVVDAVEVNQDSVMEAVSGFEAEAQGLRASSVPEWAALEVGGSVKKFEVEVGLAVELQTKNEQLMRIYQGLSSDTRLEMPGQYTMLVHEILGDQAGTEAAAMVIDDIHKRGLCTKDCIFIPKRASTFLAPTAPLQRTAAEVLLHRWGHEGVADLQTRQRYSARNFHKDALLAEPQPIEILDFQQGPEVHQERTLEFRTRRDGAFEGIHLHMLAECDDDNHIDTLKLHTSEVDQACSWSTTYVILVEEPIELAAGSRIICKCVADLRTELAKYCVEVSIGEQGEERHVAEYRWQGG